MNDVTLNGEEIVRFVRHLYSAGLCWLVPANNVKIWRLVGGSVSVVVVVTLELYRFQPATTIDKERYFWLCTTFVFCMYVHHTVCTCWYSSCFSISAISWWVGWRVPLLIKKIKTKNVSPRALCKHLIWWEWDTSKGFIIVVAVRLRMPPVGGFKHN